MVTNTGSIKGFIKKFQAHPAWHFFLIVFIARTVQLGQLYFFKTPSGGAFVERAALGFFCALIADFAAIAILTSIFALSTLAKGRLRTVFCSATAVITWVYLAACASNDQILRWMGQHLTFSFLSTYSVSRMDSTLAFNVIYDGLFSFGLTAVILLLVLFFFFRVLKKGKSVDVPKITTAGFATVLIAIACVCGNAHNFFKPCHIRWQLIQPPYITLADELEYIREHSQKPENFDTGIALLGGNAQKEFPFFHAVSNEDSLAEAFKQKPMAEKKDVILLSLESFRGWAGDFRIGKNCERMPNLCRLSKEGTTFPYTYSVGYPSTEGMLGLQLGIWSHPNKVFLTNLMNTRSRALPEILGKFGYHRIVITAAEPSFDNFTPWFEKWFDRSEYNPKINTDIPLAERFKEIYTNRPDDKPLYFEWINFVTHTPFNVPSSYAEPAATSDERYAQATAYLDSAIGIILDAIEKSPRSNETIIVVTGDHSIAGAKSQEKLSELGEANSAYTWTSFIWKGPGIADSLSITKPVSHVDYAPTILHLLGIEASNHFVGHNIFSEETHNVISFRHKDAILRNDSIAEFVKVGSPSFTHARIQSKTPDWDTTDVIGGFIAEKKIDRNIDLQSKALLDAMDSWVWVLDKNLLMP
jgi:phosphoglycerol transferase MdoB-like AlkP superfamily enzyme